MSGPKAAGKAAGGGIAISTSDRKLMSTVKEVVTNSTDEEIYAMLKECNRDPNEAVARLMTEATVKHPTSSMLKGWSFVIKEKFHVVKHKKDRKKESGSMKDLSDNRQGNMGTYSRSVRNTVVSGIRSYGRGTSSSRNYTQEGSGGAGRTITAESVKENGTSFPKALSTTWGENMSYSQLVQPKTSYANTLHNALPPSSDVPNGQLSQSPPFDFEGAWPASAGSGTATNLQGAWLAGACRGTLAEMLKSGGSKSNPPSSILASGGVVPSMVPSNSSMEQLSSMQVHAVMEPMASLSLNTHASDSVARQESGAIVAPRLQADIMSYGLQDATSAQYLNNDCVAYVERGINSASIQPSDSNLSMSLEEKVQTSSGFRSGQSHLVGSDHLDEGQEGELCVPPAYEAQQYAESQQESANPDWSHEAPPIMGSPGGTAMEAAPASPRSPSMTSAVLASTASIENHHSVIIPDHIRVPEADCTMLNFGSFGAGFDGLASSPNFVAEPENQSEDVIDLGPLSPSVRTPEQKNSSATVQNLHSSGDLSPADNEAGIEEEANLEQAPAQHEYAPSYSVLNAVSVDSTTHYAVAVPEAESRVREANPVLVPYDNSTYYNSAMIRSSIPERHSSLTPQLTSSGKLGTSRPAESIGQSASQEVINVTTYPNSNPVGGPTMPSVNNGQAGMTVPQHSIHPYGTQLSGLPFGPFANTPSYPYMSPGFSYVQSPYQQNYVGGGNYHQVPAAVGAGGVKYTLPQYKTSGPVVGGMHNSVSPSSLGYSGYLDAQPASNLTVTGANASSFEDAAPQHYKDNMYLSSQQLEGTSVWLQNQLAREAQGSSYYNLPSQSLPARYSQTQTHVHPGTAVYGNAYHPQPSQLSSAQMLLQQQQALAAMGAGTQIGAMGGVGTQLGTYQQNQRGQPSWHSGGF